MSFETTLRDDTPILVRPVGRGDEPLFEKGLALLSVRSRYFRFFHPLSRFSERDLKALTDIDRRDRMAWGALDQSCDDDCPIGVARYVRLEAEPDVAEMAVTVIDSHQGRGLGGVLMAAIAWTAAGNGITTLLGNVLADNLSMLAVFEKLGSRRHATGANMIEMRMPVSRNPASYPDNRLGEQFRKVFKQLDEISAD